MSRRVFQLAGMLVLVLATLTPFAECFDRWDKNPGPANDTEIHLTAWFVGVGIVLTLAKLLRRLPPLAATPPTRDCSAGLRSTPRLAHEAPPLPTGSPPLISLRI